MFILENVPGIMHVDRGMIFSQIVESLGNLKNYYVSILKLNALDFGSVQSRKRIFFVGIHRQKASGPLLDVPTYKGQPRSFRQNIWQPQAQRRPVTSALKRKFIRCSPPNTSWTGFATPRLSTCGASNNVPCLLKEGRGFYWIDKGILSTVREEARLQGIPDSFQFPKELSYQKCSQLIGNAMSVDCICAIIKALLAH